MAEAKFKMPEDFLQKISNLGDKTDEIVGKALQAGGEVVLANVRSNLRSVIGNGTKYTSKSTGELVASLGLSPPKLDKDGNMNVKIGFNEPRRRQYAAKSKRSYYTITNAMIANVLEYGRHGHQEPKPFLKPAMAASKNDCIRAASAKLDEEIAKL